MRIPAWFALLALLALSACTRGADDTSPADDTSDTEDTGGDEVVYTAMIGPGGGTLDAGNLQLVFPMGAVLDDVEITVVEGPPLDPDFVPGTTYSFFPGDLVFWQPVSAVFSYDPDLLSVDESELGVAMYDHDDDSFWGQHVVRHPDDDEIIAHLHRFPSQPEARDHGGSQGGVLSLPLTPMNLTADLLPGPQALLTWTTSGGYGLVQMARVVPGGECDCTDHDKDHSLYCIQPMLDADGDGHADEPDPELHDGECKGAYEDDQGNPVAAQTGTYTGLQTPQDVRCTHAGEVNCWRNTATVLLDDHETSVSLGTQAGVYWFRILRWDGARYYSAESTDTTRFILFGANDPPERPRFLNAMPLTCGGVRLDWTAETESGDITTASTWRISRRQLSPSPEPFFEHVIDLGSYESFLDVVDLPKGATYVFRLEGVNVNTLTGLEQASPPAYATATTSDTEFDLDVSPDVIGLNHGWSTWVDLTLLRHDTGTPIAIDVGFETPDQCEVAGAPCLEVLSPGVTTQTDEEMRFALHDETPIGRSFRGDVVGVSTSTPPTTCSRRMVIAAASPTPNPIPRITSVDPGGVDVRNPGPFDITVPGSHFTDDSYVLYDDKPHSLSSVTDTEIVFTLSGDDLLLPDADKPFRTVVVGNSPPGGGQSNVLTLTLFNWDPPSITSISPVEVLYGTATDFDLTVTGSKFMSDGASPPNAESVVQLNGIPMDTSWVSDTELVAAVTPADLIPGTNSVQVLNPMPSIGSSNTVDLEATTQIIDCANVPGEACVTVYYAEFPGSCEEGLVTSNPIGISCTNGYPNLAPEEPSPGCHATFPIGSQVILTAHQDQQIGSGPSMCHFVGWTSCPEPDGNCYVFNLQDDTTVRANWVVQ